MHPRRDPANPLTGVFACRSPERPNLIGFTACRIIKVEGNRLEVADLDARDGTPILDLKPYIPGGDAIPQAVTPGWLKRTRPRPISQAADRIWNPLDTTPAYSRRREADAVASGTQSQFQSKD